ncbi:hybrid sensor histidine kinase/response regulator [bacterium]|nr:MAG: hybrid sensor histidine kinase/response regulator [bacterium]
MIDDQELAGLFREESEEHLQNLDEGLLRLEKNPHDSEVLQEVFRSAHSLKGAARMLEVFEVETVAHHFEDVLGSAAKGLATLTASTIERLYSALDALRALVKQAVTGAPSGVEVNAVLAQLQGKVEEGSIPETLLSIEENWAAPADSTFTAESPYASSFSRPWETGEVEPGEIEDESATPPTPSPQREIQPVEIAAAAPTYEAEIVAFHSPDPAPSAPVVKAAPAAPIATTDASWKIETIRVEPNKLDALLAMAGELIVATTRARRGRGEFEALVALWEDETKSLTARRRVLGELERVVGRHSGANENVTSEAAPALFELRRLIEREEDRLGALGALLTRLRSAYDDVASLDGVAGEMEEAIRGVRLLPLSTLFALFPRLVRDLAKSQEKEVNFIIEGGDTTADKRILEELKDPLMHMVRNAVDHGIETPFERERAGKPIEARLVLRAVQTATQVLVELRDDGRGLDESAITRSAVRKGLLDAGEVAALTPEQVRELIFSPGFSTAATITDVSGRGVGLDVVRANVQKLRGNIEVDSVRGQGTTFRLTLPVTLATTRVLLVRSGAHLYALPVEAVQSVQLITANEVFPLQGRPSFALEGAPVPLARLSDLLELPPDPPAKGGGKPAQPCVILMQGSERLGVWVDGVVDEQEIILKPLGALLQNVPNLAGATILDTGEVALVLHSGDLFKTASRGGTVVASKSFESMPSEVDAAPKRVLLVEDSITTRTQEKRILEGAGYKVTVAVDGLDGWNKLAGGEFDAVVSDVEMPNMDGLTLAARIRQNEKYRELPIILVTSLSTEADRKRGVEVGANAYITKGGFDQKALLDTLKRLA